MWGSGAASLLGGGRSILLPTKTSLLVSQVFGLLFGRSVLNNRTGSQVDITHLVSADMGKLSVGAAGV